MRALSSLHHSSARSCVLSIVLVTTMFLLPGTAEGQIRQERKEDVRVGIYVSAYGLGSELDDYFTPVNDILEGKDDIMPFPIVHASVRYNAYQSIIFWSKDRNESIFNFTGRYNFYSSKEKSKSKMFIFAGISIWYFNKKFSFRRYIDSDEFTYETDPMLTYEVKADRPDEKSITPGITGGLGIEYIFFNTIVLSHELDLYASSCKYKEFICTAVDVRLLGLHLKL